MRITKYTFQQHGDERGDLVAIEACKNIPFEIKRVYYMYGAPKNTRRGYHAHKNLEQVLVCVSGSCKVLLDDGNEQCEVVLDKPYEGLYVGNSMWREMYDFSENAVLLVLASEHYNEDDYIRDYSDFRIMVENGFGS